MDATNVTSGLSDAAMPAVRAAINSCTDIIQRRAITKPMVTVLTEACRQDDLHRNTDLRIGFAADLPIACRVRHHHYLHRYGDEFTIRSRARYGGKTEIHKVIDGEGTFVFYGFVSDTGPDRLARWFIGDLDIWRKWRLSRISTGLPTYRTEMPNGDGTHFQAYNINDLPADFIVAAYDHAISVQEPEEALF